MRYVYDFESHMYSINMKSEIYMKWVSNDVNAIQNQKVIPVWNSRQCEFSFVNTPKNWCPPWKSWSLQLNLSTTATLETEENGRSRKVLYEPPEGIQLFRERLSEEVHATIPKGVVGGFEFTVLPRNLKEWHKRQRRMFANAKGKQQ